MLHHGSPREAAFPRNPRAHHRNYFVGSVPFVENFGPVVTVILILPVLPPVREHVQLRGRAAAARV